MTEQIEFRITHDVLLQEINKCFKLSGTFHWLMNKNPDKNFEEIFDAYYVFFPCCHVTISTGRCIYMQDVPIGSIAMAPAMAIDPHNRIPF